MHAVAPYISCMKPSVDMYMRPSRVKKRVTTGSSRVHNGFPEVQKKYAEDPQWNIMGYAGSNIER